MTRLMTAVLIAAAAVIMLAAGYVVGGQTGLFAVVALAAVAGLLVARLRIPPPPSRPSAPRRAKDSDSAFEGYRRIDTAVSLAQTSARFFDHTTKPLLYRLLVVLLADRHHMDVGKDPGAAREAVGDDLWPLLDPARPASNDSRAPGVSEQTLARIVDRLEDL
jgi:hypothetical protein